MNDEFDPLKQDKISNALRARNDERKKRRHERAMEDVADVLKTPAGRRLYWRILSESHVMSASFVPGHNDVTFFREGKRDIGLILLSDVLRVDAKLFLQMQQEADSEAKQDASEDEKIKEEYDG